MKIFVVYIGGTIKNANIELHDVRFVIAETFEDTFDTLRSEWWGTPSSLHIDCYQTLEHADGYNISLKPYPPENPTNHKLYFVNLGGYDRVEFAEQHKNVFVIADDEAKAKVEAIKHVSDWADSHRDFMYEVEKTFCLNKLAKEKSLYIHLEKAEKSEAQPFTCKYIPIGKKKTAATL